ncbi:hypothetical protein KUV73_11085 [Mameliella alba]|nr:hypothetical protein [Mameliella alba]MBY6170114.1 hypothetical protein [Mameliella alba]MBY6174909.1 hypothetical protein [Mameliella alba]
MSGQGHRLIVRMGTGIGDTVLEAAQKALADAQTRARLHVDVECRVVVTLGLPKAAGEVDTGALPVGDLGDDVEMRVVPGGMMVDQPNGRPVCIVSAAIEHFPKALSARG